MDSCLVKKRKKERNIIICGERKKEQQQHVSLSTESLQQINYVSMTCTVTDFCIYHLTHSCFGAQGQCWMKNRSQYCYYWTSEATAATVSFWKRMIHVREKENPQHESREIFFFLIFLDLIWNQVRWKYQKNRIK